MTDEELVEDLERVFSAAIMRGATVEDLETAIEEAGGRVKQVRQLTEGT